jgi:phage tail sheath protein FI
VFDSSLGGYSGPTSVVSYRNDTLSASSSYAVMDSGYKYMYDSYNDQYRWVPLNPDVAGLVVRTESQTDPWYSPAGYNRGKIMGVVKLALNPNKAERDELYEAGINPVVTFPGEGTILFGDKTLQRRATALDRINVRRLMIHLEKAIATAAKYQLFEFNDAFTRRSFVNMINPFLRRVQAQRGVTDFRVVCDDNNNTSQVIDNNEFIADIFIKPTKSINYIQLNFTVLRSDALFTESVS